MADCGVMVRAARLTLLLSAVLTTGCSREPTGPAPATEVTSAVTSAVPLVTVPLVTEAWVMQAIESTGPRAALVAVLHPDRWTGAQPRLAGLLAQLPGATGSIAAAADPSQWLPQIFAVLGVDLPPLPAIGWDRSRPLIVALGEVPLEAPSGTLAATVPLRELPGLRHQILVPASDPSALISAYVGAIVSRGARPPRLIQGHPGAVIFTLPDRTLELREDDAALATGTLESHGGGDWLAVIPEVDQIRIVIVHGGVYPTDHFAAAAHPREPLRLPGAAPKTSGVATLASALILGGMLRPQRLTALRTWIRAQETAMALTRVGADQLAEAERTGLRIMVGCEMLYGDEVPEVEDWTLALAADDAALRLRLVTSLTPHGAAIVDAGVNAAAAPLTLSRADTIGHAWLRFDGDAAKGVLKPPSTLLDPDEDLALMMQECGAWSALLGPAAPFGNSQRLWGSMLAGVTTPAPEPPGSISQLAITQLRLGELRGALAVHTPGVLDADAREGVPILGGLIGVETEVHSEPEGSGERSRIGFGVDPRTVFGAPAPTAELALMQLELGPVASAVETHAPGLAAALRPHVRASLLAGRSGQAVEAELVLGDAAPRLHDLGAYTWPAPVAGAACSQGYARALHRLLRAADEPGLTIPAAAQQLQAVEATLGCPALVTLAPVLRRTGLLILADAFADRSRIADARELLTAPCSAGDAVVCARLAVLRDAVAPTLPIVATTCPDNFPGGQTLAVDSKGISLAGVRLADAKALAKAVLEQAALRPHRIELALEFDAGLTIAALRPVLAVLGDPALRLFVSVRTADSPRLRRLPLAAIDYDDDNQADARERIGLDRYLDAYTLHIDRVPVKLLASAPQSPSLPPDTQIPAGAHLRVAASDTATWGTVAAALARGCEDTRLIDPNGPALRALKPE